MWMKKNKYYDQKFEEKQIDSKYFRHCRNMLKICVNININKEDKDIQKYKKKKYTKI